MKDLEKITLTDEDLMKATGGKRAVANVCDDYSNEASCKQNFRCVWKMLKWGNMNIYRCVNKY